MRSIDPHRPVSTVLALCALLFLALAACGETEASDSIRGVVRDGLGTPLPGVELSTGEASVRSEADGTFTLPATELPYDLVVRQPGSSRSRIYLGLESRRPDLTVSPWADGTSSATISVHEPSEEGAETGTLHILTVVGDTPNDCCGTNVTEDGLRWYSLYWRDAPAVVVQAYAFRYERDRETQGPVRYTGFAEAELRVKSGARIDWDVVFEPFTLEQTTVEVNAILPDGYAPWFTSLQPVLGNNAGSNSLYVNTVGRSARFVLPKLEGLKARATAVAYSDGSTISGSTDVDLTHPRVDVSVLPGPVAESPADAALGVGSDTQLVWTHAGEGTFVVHIWPTEDQLGAPSFEVVTSQTTLPLSELLRLGLPALPSGVHYSWQVFAEEGVSVDDVAAWDWPSAESQQYGYSHPRRFTTR